MLKIKGNHFKLTDKNSASTKKIFVGKLKIAVDQKSVPSPTKKSLVINPTNILPNPSNIRGRIIKKDDSWIWFKVTRVPLKLFIKVK